MLTMATRRCWVPKRLQSPGITWSNVRSIALLSAIGFTIGLVYRSSPLFLNYGFRVKIEDSSIRKYYYRGSKANGPVQACTIPATPATPKFFRHNWKPSIQDCSYEQQMAVLRNETSNSLHQEPDLWDKIHIPRLYQNNIIITDYCTQQNLVFMPGIPSPCCIQEITRGKNDQESGLTDCEYVVGNNNMEVPTKLKEAILISCGRFVNAEALIPIRPDVQEKINYWERVPEEERLPSVFIIGIDSTSRAHVYRSLPQSIDLMMKLGFVDFQSYHSVAPNTLSNFMAFLMGLTRNQVRSSCAPNWITPFDNCPLVWKLFSEQKYITSYIEDGSQSFNWGGQSGFNKKPTDYYLHHLFQQLRKIRSESVHTRNGELDCTSTETIPEFVLRYSTRFVRKFSKTPFFHFTWMANPFHDDVYALAAIDRKLATLFETISMNEDLLRNALIIFLSDHGDRTSFFSSSEPSAESYIERGLPPLFLRLPDRLKSEHPEIMRTLNSNSQLLTTPFDVHQTLLHVLSIRLGAQSVPASSKTDRSSLLNIFLTNRTCGSTNIPAASCLCNVDYKETDEHTSDVGKNFTTQVLRFAIERLNAKVESSKYRRNCSRWEPSQSNYHRIISRNNEFVESVIAFTVSPGQSTFEARVQTPRNQDGSLSNSAKVIGFARTNHYGDQSWCIRGETDEDKKMKELCYCI